MGLNVVIGKSDIKPKVTGFFVFPNMKDTVFIKPCLGKVLQKRTPYRDDTMYSYDIESTKEYFGKLQNGEVRLYGIEKYQVSHSSIWYTYKYK